MLVDNHSLQSELRRRLSPRCQRPLLQFINVIEFASAMLAKAWACAHPTHIVEGAFFEPQEIPSLPDVQKWILVCFFNGFSPLIVTEVSRGEFGPWATEQFPHIHGTARGKNSALA
jgi:hypothetical protein